MDGDDALVRRIVDAAVTPALLAKEGTTALLEACDANASVIFTHAGGSDIRIVSAAGCDLEGARSIASAATRSTPGKSTPLLIEPIGRDVDVPRFAVVSGLRPFGLPLLQRFPHALHRAIARGSNLCAARDRPVESSVGAMEQLEPLLPVRVRERVDAAGHRP
jgi:hypothetical protein